MSAKRSAGMVPPSTGAPPNSVSIGSRESAWPTQTQAVMSGVAPQNQASPLSSVVPVFPQVVSPVIARLPVPDVTTLSSVDTAVAAVSGLTTWSRTDSFTPLLPSLSSTGSPSSLGSPSNTPAIATGPPLDDAIVPETRSPSSSIVL